MPRPLKFRIWNTIAEAYCSAYRYGGEMSEIEQDSFEIWQQFTGLVDKNGKDIFEGDLVRYSVTSSPFPSSPVVTTIGEIFFEEGAFLLDRTARLLPSSPQIVKNSLEVVGTAQENRGS